MALVNDAKKEINVKIVYIGTADAGKDTALRWLHRNLPAERRSELKCLSSGGHEMLFFDYAYPMAPAHNGYQVRFHVYTLLPGTGSAAPWKMLLKGVDGVVFLADSSVDGMPGNLECRVLLLDALSHYGICSGTIPISLQCNKRDLADALPLAKLKAELFPDLAGEPLPVVALTGDGLMEGLDKMATAILAALGQTLPVAMPTEAPWLSPPVPDESEEDFAAVEEGRCLGDSEGFAIESVGVPESMANGKVRIPLRLVGGECGKSIDFSVTVEVSLE